MFELLKIVGMSTALFGMESVTAMPELRHDDSGQVKVEVTSPEAEFSEQITGINETENTVENIGQDQAVLEGEVQSPEESNAEEIISEDGTQDLSDSGMVLNDSDDEVSPEVGFPTEFISGPENVNPIEDVQNPWETNTQPEGIDLDKTNSMPEIGSPTDETSTGSSTGIVEIIPSPEVEAPVEPTSEIGEVGSDSGVESGSEIESNKGISGYVMRVLTVIKDKSIIVGFLRKVFNLFF